MAESIGKTAQHVYALGLRYTVNDVVAQAMVFPGPRKTIFQEVTGRSMTPVGLPRVGEAGRCSGSGQGRELATVHCKLGGYELLCGTY